MQIFECERRDGERERERRPWILGSKVKKKGWNPKAGVQMVGGSYALRWFHRVEVPKAKSRWWCTRGCLISSGLCSTHSKTRFVPLGSFGYFPILEIWRGNSKHLCQNPRLSCSSIATISYIGFGANIFEKLLNTRKPSNLKDAGCRSTISGLSFLLLGCNFFNFWFDFWV